MPRLLSLLPALAAVTVTLTPTAQPAGAVTRSAPPAADATPLQVTIDSLSPSVIPDRGPIRMTGSVTNTSPDPWLDVNTYPFAASSPITSARKLAEQAAVDPVQPVGDRVTTSGAFDDVGDLAPGESAQFAITVPVSALRVGEPGVYWFGVHALGEGPEGRDLNADGRARTFLPLVPRSDEQVQAALVVPVRRSVRHQPDGSVADVERWAAELESGPLRALVDFGASAGSRPLTWLVDPAVPETVRALVSGNPPRSLDDTLPPPDDAPPEPDEPEGPEAGPTTEPASGAASAPPPGDVPTNAATEPGRAWLGRFGEAIRGDHVLALPYGDLDVSAAAERDPAVYRIARRRSAAVPWGRRTHPAVAAPSGYLDPGALGLVSRSTTVLVTDRMLAVDVPAVRASGRRLLIASSAAGEGGPGPDDPLAAVALRQRILSEAAVRLLRPGGGPLVVVLPQDWAPASTTGFFEGLDVRWLDLRTVGRLSTPRAVPVDRDQLDYPPPQAARELDAANFAAAEGLIRAGEALQNLLLRNDRVAAAVTDEALSSLSYGSRDHPQAARVRANRSRAWIADRLGAVSVRAPRAVTLSSSSGRFAATISNRLAHPVTVRLEAVSDRPIRIESPAEIELAAESRTSILLRATTERLGVHNVQLVLTDVDGVPLGSTDSLPIRSAQVSEVIWVILATGVALLFGAIAVRLVRRLRRAAA